MKDKEQDMRLHKIEKDIFEIKGVTHGNDVHKWDGIISEHGKLVEQVTGLKTNSDYITKFTRDIVSFFKIIGTILGVILSAFAVYHLVG